MRTFLLGALTITTLSLTGADAQAAPWCAHYARGGTNCGFYSFDQCRDAISGLGGHCARNPLEGRRRPLD